MFYAKTKSSPYLIGVINLTATSPSAAEAHGLPKLATAQGIGIGSSSAALKKAFPHLISFGNGEYGTTASRTKLPATDYSVGADGVTGFALRSVNVG